MESDNETENEMEIDLRRQRLREFYHFTHVLFTKPERLILYKILKDYQKRHDIERLIIGLNLILRTYTKLELLKYVRYFLWEGHIKEFDRLTKFHMRFRKRRKGKSSNSLQVPQGSERMSINSTSTGGPKIRDVRVFTLIKERGEHTIGFSIRGGSEHGLGIYISDIDMESAAEKCGLQVGDKILEANNISLKGVASSSAVKVLTGFSKVKLVVQRARKVPEWRLSREKTSWVDVHDRKLISGEFEECGITHHIRGLEVDDPERRVSLKFGKTDRTLGFNVRGGREYGVGIYVSKVDKEGLADKNGVRVGDQIIDVNGVPFDNITHANAVEVLKGKRHLILTLKDVGRFPAFKELYAEYTWSDTNMRSASSMTGIQDIRIEDMDQHKSRSVSDLFSRDRRPSVLQSEIFLPSEIVPSTSGLAHGGDDIDSLSDLEHWAHSNNDRDYVHSGYESDREAGSENIIVHVEDVDNDTDVKHVIPLNDSDSDMNDGENIDVNDVHVHKTEHVNYLYAKINNGSLNDDGGITDDTRDNFAEYDAVPVNSRVNSKVYNNVNGDIDKDNVAESVNVSETDDTNFTEFTLREKVYDHNAFSNYNEVFIQRSSVGGSLYSKVKDIGPPSFKGQGQGQPKPGTSLSDADSIASLNTSRSNESDSRNFSNQQTLQIRTINGSNNHNNHDSDDSSEGGHKSSKSKMYVLNKENDDVDESESGKKKSGKGKGKKGSYNVNSIPEDDLDVHSLEGRLKELEKRQTNIGLQELNTLSPNTYDAADSAASRKSTWKAFKNKIKGSLRAKPPRRRELTLPKDKDSTRGDVTLRRGLHAMVPNTIDDYNMAAFEEAASKMLKADEYENVMRNVKMYHETHDLDRLIEMLLVTLDNPEKILLLRDVRGIIYPLDIVRFDNRVNKYEIEAYQKLSMKLHLPLNHKQLKRPRKTIITTEIGKRRYKRKSVSFAKNPSSIPSANVSLESGEAEDGHFHIRPLDQYEKEEDIVGIMRSHVMDKKQGSLSRRDGQTLDNDIIRSQIVSLEQHHPDNGFSLDSQSDYSSFGSGDNDKYPGSTTIHLSKTKPSIGIDLYETVESGQREVRIRRIDPHGAANDDNDIEVGMTLLAIDRHKLDGYTKDEVMGLLQKCYADKQHVSMKLVVFKDQSTNL